MPRNVVHYLRKERRKRALSQADMCALLAARWKSRISRYEREQKLPPLETALAFEAIYKKPVSEIFGPAYGKILKDVRRRAEHLLATDAGVPSTRRFRRRRALEEITA
jgi:transcriptional regulator with XRE-family HTH domain